MSAASEVDSTWFDVLVRSATKETPEVLLLELAPLAGEFPPFEPGAHIAIACGNEQVRHYSLCGPLDCRGSYQIAVKLDPSGRGGSQWIWEHAKVGSALRISSPRDNFPLVYGKPRYLFISGGIGVTPVMTMLDRLRELNVNARLVHMCRSPEELAFHEHLRSFESVHDIHVHIDALASGLYDIQAELERSAPDTEVYCCGPAPMMEAVRAFAQASGRAAHYHFEFFAGPSQSELVQGHAPSFVVVQNSTGREIPVREDQTMLAALREAGLRVQSECEYGVCGWCATGVVSGEPQHLDSYLTDAERSAKNIVLPCVSRCTGGKLVLDL